MSPLLFGLFFDRVVAYVSTHLPADSSSDDCYSVAFLVIQLALYADDIAVLAPSVPACQRMVDLIAAFCTTNGLTINTADDKSQIMLLNCVGTVQVYGVNLCQVTEFKYLGITLRSEGYASRRMRGVGQALDRATKARNRFYQLRSHCRFVGMRSPQVRTNLACAFG